MDARSRCRLDERHALLPETIDKEETIEPHEGLLRNYVSFLASADHPLENGGYHTVDIGELEADIADNLNAQAAGPNSTFTASGVRTDPGSPSDGGTSGGYMSIQGHCGGCNCTHDEDWVSFLQTCCFGGTARGWFHDAAAGAFCFGGTLTGGCGIVVSSNCVGRCGRSCFAPGVYTQDCMDHDRCIVRLGGGAADPGHRHCGDEFMEAANDVAYIYGATFFGFMIYGPGAIPISLAGCY